MQFLIDNLIAIVVGAVLLGALVIIQMRGQQSAIAASADYRAQSMTSGLATTLEREVENMRSREETEGVFAAAAALPSVGADQYRFRLRQTADGEGGTYTSQFSFPTLLNPQHLGASDIAIVTYWVQPTGDRAVVDGRERPLYLATRYVYERGGPTVRTDVFGGILDFDITATSDLTGTLTNNVGVDMATFETPPRVHIDIRTASAQGMRRAQGEGVAPVTSTRHARSIRIASAMAPSRALTVDETTPGGIPLMPGDPGAPAAVDEPPAPGGTGGTTPPSDYPGTGTGGTGTGGTGTGGTGTGGDDTPTPRNNEVVICHLPGVENHTMVIRKTEQSTHFGHGDSAGACR